MYDCDKLRAMCKSFEKALAKNPLPCPFCGGDPVACMTYPADLRHREKPLWCVSCGICGASTGPHLYPGYALRSWLLRASDA